MVKCDRCRHCRPNYSAMSKNDVGLFECRKGVHDLTQVKDIENHEVECDLFDSRYIEYPLEISGIDYPDGRGIDENHWSAKTGDLVAVRPCGEEYDDKTYLGLFIGEADVGLFIQHHPDTKRLKISRHYNPAMLVPELGKVIYGMGSWWKKIKSLNDFKEITQDEINNVWYVTALKHLEKQLKEEDEDENEDTD